MFGMMEAMQIVNLILLLLLLAAGVAIFMILKRTPQTPPNLLEGVQIGQQQLLQTILQQLNAQQQSQENQSAQIHNRVAETSQVLTSLQTKLAQLEEGNKRILDMSTGITELQNILQAPKLRGNRGEMWLGELLAQMLPKARFQVQYQFKSGDTCDAVIFMRDGMLLPIDSKFSLENFKKMLDSKEPSEKKLFEKQFVSDIKRRIDEIASKYIQPAAGTLNFAFMYVPAENVYYQAFVEDPGGHNLQHYAFERHVIPVSPNSLYPYLEIVLFGLRGLEIEESAREIQQGLINLVGDLRRFDEDYRKVGNNLRLAQQNFETSDRKLTGVQTRLNTISHQELPNTGEPIKLEVPE